MADLVIRRRAELGYRNQEDVARDAGVGVTTWRQVEGAKQEGYRPVIEAAVTRVLGWPPDMLSRIAKGEDPPPSENETVNRRLDAVEEAVEELRAGVAELRQAVLDDAGQEGAAL